LKSLESYFDNISGASTQRKLFIVKVEVAIPTAADISRLLVAGRAGILDCYSICYMNTG